MHASRIFQAVIGLLAATVLALPHELMVNNEFVRDVGIAYSDSNFGGVSVYLMQDKKTSKCQTDIAGRTFRSAQICVPAACILYKSNDCTADEAGSDIYLQGPVDVNTFPALSDTPCNSYMCGTVEDMQLKMGGTASTSQIPGGGYWSVAGH
ncbi:hypothetical protein C7974DRAFT_101877 [Boeremia exigua]|uniref:uncharacterized protein n=1 Tax=Boeremia exigua TaxID=749465 RepID=UPI001E8DAB61|nr:uncharacterized protein C7974DRAFT_101877 [Boeremia exigua]KAH6642417.1 hypothetical protein C7974DRAFT_101877 [Boeremia exigua]